jgi:hypothetical protein
VGEAWLSIVTVCLGSFVEKPFSFAYKHAASTGLVALARAAGHGFAG